MNRDYFSKMSMQPGLDCIIDSFNPVRIDCIFQHTIGLDYNTTEICLNADADIAFIPLFFMFHNLEGGARGLQLLSAAGNVLNYIGTTASGTSYGYSAYGLYGIMCARVRLTAAGLVTNAATSMYVLAWRLER